MRLIAAVSFPAALCIDGMQAATMPPSYRKMEWQRHDRKQGTLPWDLLPHILVPTVESELNPVNGTKGQDSPLAPVWGEIQFRTPSFPVPYFLNHIRTEIMGEYYQP
jgi:hypothetical protein